MNGHTFCSGHEPSRAESRSRAASRAGSMRWSTDLNALVDRVSAIVAAIEDGTIDPHKASVMFTGLRLIRELTIDAREAYTIDELTAEIDALSEVYDAS